MRPLLLMSMVALGALLAPEAFARVPDQDSRVRIQAPPRNEARNASLPYADREAQSGILREFKGGRDVVLVTEYDWYILVTVLVIVIIVLAIVL